MQKKTYNEMHWYQSSSSQYFIISERYILAKWAAYKLNACWRCSGGTELKLSKADWGPDQCKNPDPSCVMGCKERGGLNYGESLKS